MQTAMTFLRSVCVLLLAAALGTSAPGQERRVLLQNETNAAGYFLGTNRSGAFQLKSPLSRGEA